MEIIFLLLALSTLFFYLTVGIELAIGQRTIPFLKDSPPLVSINPPRVSVIIPACNEERSLADALQSVLHQTYDNLEIIVVNDRSTDLTRVILEQIAQQSPQVRVITIAELPRHWLGKNHALFYGAREATGKLLLFTDADVFLKPQAISQAVNYLLTHRLDHLTCVPDQNISGLALRVFIATFGFIFSIYAKPWRVKRPNRWHIGIGAFQLIRSDFYHRCGAHVPIAMRPDDDMKLGKLIKQHGGQQEMLWGQNVLQVTWYHSLRELIRGLMKNAFAGVEYRFSLVIASTIAMLVFNVFPFVAIFVTHGLARWIYGGVLVTIFLIFWDSARFMKIGRWYALGYPFAILIFIYILWKSALTAIFRGTIEWRGTRYSLEELRANKI